MEFMEEVVFIGVDIIKSVNNLLQTTDVCNDMTPSEKKIYDIGVINTLSALNIVLKKKEPDGYVYIHIPGKSVSEEMNYTKLSKIVL